MLRYTVTDGQRTASWKKWVTTTTVLQKYSFKDHFRKLTGTKITQFEGHFAEIILRSSDKGYVYQAFFDFLWLLTLTGPAAYTYLTTLFNTWKSIPTTNSQFNDWEIHPSFTHVRCIFFKVYFYLFLCFSHVFSSTAENTDAKSEASYRRDIYSEELFSSSILTSRVTIENRKLSSGKTTREKSSVDKVFDEMLGSWLDEVDNKIKLKQALEMKQKW